MGTEIQGGLLALIIFGCTLSAFISCGIIGLIWLFSHIAFV